MADRGRVDLRLATQILLLQVVVVMLTLVTAFGLFAEFNRHRLAIQYEIRALDIARVVASAPAVRTNISRYDAVSLNPTPALVDELAAGPLQGVAALVKRRTDVLFVVIANTRGIS